MIIRDRYAGIIKILFNQHNRFFINPFQKLSGIPNDLKQSLVDILEETENLHQVRDQMKKRFLLANNKSSILSSYGRYNTRSKR